MPTLQNHRTRSTQKSSKTVIVYAGQLVICPCLYKPVMDAANDPDGVEDGRPVDGSDDAGRRLSRQEPATLLQIRTSKKNDALRRDAWKLVRWKFRGDKLLIALYFAARTFRRRVAATPRLPRGYSAETSRGDAAATRRRRGRDAAATRTFRSKPARAAVTSATSAWS